MDFSGSVSEIFVAEAKELLAKMEEVLLKMEQGEQNPDFINSIFRSAHTLKGAAAMFSFTELSGFAHEIENLLAVFRESKASVSKTKIAVLLGSVDCLANLMDGSVKGNISQETIARKQELIKKLKLNDDSDGNSVQNTPSTLSVQSIPSTPSMSKAPIIKEQTIVVDAVDPKNIPNINAVNTETPINIIKNFIKVDASKLDEIINLIGEVVIVQAHLNNLIKEKQANNEELINTSERTFKLIDDLRVLSLQLRMLPVKEIFSKFTRVVRDIAVQKNKQIKLQIDGADTELDKSIIEKINEPLLHLIRNACDHGIDLPEDRVALGKPTCGLVTLQASQENSEVVITTSDDGRGIDLDRVKQKAISVGLIKKDSNLSEQEILACIFEPGFSTSEEVTDLSGRGVGMDVVKKEVEKLHGSIQIKSEKMIGTTISIRLPLTLAIINGLLIKITNFPCVIPMWNVTECIEITSDEYKSIKMNHYMNFRNKILPGIVLSSLLGITTTTESNTAIIVQYADYKVGIIVDYLEGEIQTVIKPMPDLFAGFRWINGTTILGNGEVAVILDMPGLIADVIEKHKHISAVAI